MRGLTVHRSEGPQCRYAVIATVFALAGIITMTAQQKPDFTGGERP